MKTVNVTQSMRTIGTVSFDVFGIVEDAFLTVAALPTSAQTMVLTTMKLPTYYNVMARG